MVVRRRHWARRFDLGTIFRVVSWGRGRWGVWLKCYGVVGTSSRNEAARSTSWSRYLHYPVFPTSNHPEYSILSIAYHTLSLSRSFRLPTILVRETPLRRSVLNLSTRLRQLCTRPARKSIVQASPGVRAACNSEAYLTRGKHSMLPRYAEVKQRTEWLFNVIDPHLSSH